MRRVCVQNVRLREWKARKRAKLKVENIVVHKTLKRAQNEKQQSAYVCGGIRIQTLTQCIIFISFMNFMVKMAVLCALASLCETWF